MSKGNKTRTRTRTNTIPYGTEANAAGEVGARALRVRSDERGHGQVRLCKALGCGRCGCLKPIRACCVVGSAFFLVAPPRGGCAMAPRDSGMCWKQFMMCLEEIQFVAGVHSPPMHDPGLEEFQRPVRVCECKGASVLPCLLSRSSTPTTTHPKPQYSTRQKFTFGRGHQCLRLSLASTPTNQR